MEYGGSSLKEWIKKSGREALILAVRLVLVILPVVAGGILLLLLFLQNTTVNLVIFGFTATLCLGLLAGFLARLILKKSSFALRFLAAAVALFAGMMVMYLISSGKLGLSPYIRTVIDWYGLVQIGIGLGAVFIALNGFRRKQVPVEGVVPADISASATGSVQPLVRSTAAATVITPVPTNRKSTAKKSKTATKKAAEKKKVVVGKKPVANTTPAVRRSRKKVTLAAFDEHRCPYCLEEVKRNDLRGVVVCPICKAYHHKDCWDITGRCQVPHDTPV